MIKVNPYEVASADIVVGIPSYNEAGNIAFVVDQINKGLLNYFPHYKTVVINVDNWEIVWKSKLFISANKLF